MYTLLINIIFSLLTVFSLHSTFDALLEQGIRSNRAMHEYSTNLKGFLNTLKSPDLLNAAERNSVIDVVVTSVDKKIQEVPVQFNKLTSAIKEELFKNSALFSPEEQDLVSNKLSEMNQTTEATLAQLQQSSETSITPAPSVNDDKN
jgi:hypothetical protein